jgi:hypothetical protein
MKLKIYDKEFELIEVNCEEINGIRIVATGKIWGFLVTIKANDKEETWGAEVILGSSISYINGRENPQDALEVAVLVIQLDQDQILYRDNQ